MSANYLNKDLLRVFKTTFFNILGQILRKFIVIIVTHDHIFMTRLFNNVNVIWLDSVVPNMSIDMYKSSYLFTSNRLKIFERNQ